MGLNVIRMDSKGRISIPFFLRNLLELDYGDQLILETNGRKEITATPVNRAETSGIGAGIKGGLTKKCYFVGSR